MRPFLVIAALAATALGTALSAHAQTAPTASAEISATRGDYRADLEDWEVRVSWTVGCSGGDGYAWTVYLRGRPGGELIDSRGEGPTNSRSVLRFVQARGRPYQVVPEIHARCFAGGVSSEVVVVSGSPVTIPPQSEGDQDGDGTGDDFLDENGEFDHRRRGGDGNGHGGYGGGGTTVRLPERCENAIAGSSNNDVLNGTRGPDTMLGFDGSDRVYGLGDADCLLGHRGTDLLSGGGGPDIADGGSSGDFIAGGRGDDTLRGGPGRDRLRANGGRNRLFGGGGNDRLDARNGRSDLVNCGRGRRDVAQVDRADRARGCELRAR